jgi:hypothetical protein
MIKMIETLFRKNCGKFWWIHFPTWGKMLCPACDSSIEFISGRIEANIESKGNIEVEDMLSLGTGCRNPLCKWSNVKGEFQK